jgi:predicted O-methyltransferase YrrM
MALPVEHFVLSRQYPAVSLDFMFERERHVLADLANRIPVKVVIEIGINEGNTAKFLLDNCPAIERYIGIDVLPGYLPGFTEQQREVPVEAGRLVRDMIDKVVLLVTRRGSLDVNVDDLPKADLVLIDGDHCADMVLHDTALARGVINPGGAVVWHDYKRLDDRGRPDRVNVSEVLEEMQHGGADIRHIDGTWLAIEHF